MAVPVVCPHGTYVKRKKLRFKKVHFTKPKKAGTWLYWRHSTQHLVARLWQMRKQKYHLEGCF